jgi:hypothetical protein
MELAPQLPRLTPAEGADTVQMASRVDNHPYGTPRMRDVIQQEADRANVIELFLPHCISMA